MVPVSGGSVTDHLCQNIGSAAHRMTKLFNNQHTGTFRHDETITVTIKRTAGMQRIIVAGGQGFKRTETCQTHGDNARFGTTGDHHIGIITFDHPIGFTDGVASGGTCSCQTEIRTAHAVTYGNVSGSNITDHHGDQKRRNPSGTAVEQHFVFPFQSTETADTAGDDHAVTVAVGTAFAGFNIESGIAQSLFSSDHCILGIQIHVTCFFRGDVLGNVQIFDLTGNMGTVCRGIKTGDLTETATAVDQRIPKIRHVVTDTGKHAATGNNHSSFIHKLHQTIFFA